MQAERARRSSQLFPDGLLDGAASRSVESNGVATIHASSSSVSSFSSPTSDSPSGVNYIEHRVSKMDTLPGVAIKYGVEVADIKRLNGLMTDIQMYARKTLRIPLPGRHPPSPCLPNGSDTNGCCSGEHTPPRRSNDVLDLLQSFNLKTSSCEVSPAMTHLQAYYGLTPVKNGPVLAGTEVSVYKNNGFCLNDELLPTELSFSDPLLSQRSKSTSLVDEFLQKNGDITSVKDMLEAAENNEIEKSIRRRQKNDVNISLGTPETLMKEDNGNVLSGRKGKGLAMRPKSGSRTDTDMVYQNTVPNRDTFMTDGFVSVRKSSSTSSLQESENSSSSIWSTSKWNLKPEVLARPLFDGLPKPVTPWKKAALD